MFIFILFRYLFILLFTIVHKRLFNHTCKVFLRTMSVKKKSLITTLSNNCRSDNWLWISNSVLYSSDFQSVGALKASLYILDAGLFICLKVKNCFLITIPHDFFYMCPFLCSTSHLFYLTTISLSSTIAQYFERFQYDLLFLLSPMNICTLTCSIHMIFEL